MSSGMLAPDAVQAMFDRISPVYDPMNRFMTAGLDRRWRRLAVSRVVRPGDRVLDACCGTGDLALAAQEAGGTVTGLDFSERMLERARHKSSTVEWVRGDAMALPFEDGSFDAAVSTQVLEYVDDVPRALAEARRVLRPGGRLLVLDTDWDSIVWHSGEPERMRRVLAAWDRHLADPYLPRRLPRLLTDAGFTLTRTSVLPILNHPYDPHTYSAGLIPVIAAFVDDAAWADELTGLGADYFFSINRYLFVATATP
jgi:arsenite methyltransferase